MRIWHKDLIPVLPQEQLNQQWRECCGIVKAIAEKGTPNNSLVNRIMDYPINHFFIYSSMIKDEMVKRGGGCNFDKFVAAVPQDKLDSNLVVNHDNLFANWHTDRYLRQCYYMLEEKYDCGSITEEEFNQIHSVCKHCLESQEVKDNPSTKAQVINGTVSMDALLQMLKTHKEQSDRSITITL